MNWLAQFFLNPGLVIPGLALTSLPLLIHILSRLKFRTVRFAAMEFLLQSDELNRRRLILEQLLLLLLRMLIVLLIAFLLARLVMDPNRLLMLRGSSVHHVVILDDTMSLRERVGDKTVFDHALETLQNMISEAAAQQSAARITILTVTDPTRPVISDRPLDGLLFQETAVRLRALTCSYQASGPSAALKTAREILSADGGASPQVHILTDFRKSDWQNRPEVTESMAALQSINASVRIIRLVDEAGANIAVTQLSGETTAVATGVPWRLSLTAHNYGNTSVKGRRGRVLVDGVPMPSGILLPELESGAEQSVSHDITFQSTGRHQIEVRLDDDVLSPDNSRFVAVDVTEKRRILIVDDEQQQQDAGYVTAAISADPDLTGLTTDIRTSQVLTSVELSQYDLIYLLNIRDLPADAVVSITEYTRGGGGIAWFPGDQANMEWYTTLSTAGSERIFPVPLASIQSADGSGAAPDDAEDNNSSQQSPVFATHPIFSVYNTPDSPFSDAVQIRTWLQIADSWMPEDKTRQDGVRTLARLRNGSPIIFEHSLERGRILTFLTGAGKRWCNWPIAPAGWGYVVVHLSMHPYLQRRSDTVQTQEISDSIQFSWPASQYADTAELFLPEPTSDESSRTGTFVRLKATPDGASEKEESGDSGKAPSEPGVSENTSSVSGSPMFHLTLNQADRPGIYRLRRFSGAEGTATDTWLAVNAPVSESDLATADADLITGSSELRHVRVQEARSADSLGGNTGGREIRWLLLGLLVTALVAEQRFSLRMSHHPEGS